MWIGVLAAVSANLVQPVAQRSSRSLQKSALDFVTGLLR
jgi:hypothetical protein